MTEDEKIIPEAPSAEQPAATDSLPGDFTPTSADTIAQMPSVVVNPRPLKKGMVVAAFILFGFSLIAFGFFEFFSITLLFMPLINGAANFGEAIAMIFTFVFGIAISLGLAVVQLLVNIPPIVLFAKLIQRANTKGQKALFIIFLVLTSLLLLLMLVTIGLFFLATGANAG